MAHRGAKQDESTETSSKGLWVVLAASAGLLLLLVAVTTGFTNKFLPSSVASKVGYNSESYLFALVLTPWVYYVARGRRGAWWSSLALALGVLWLMIGWVLLHSSLPSPIRTLNEPALALGVALPYATLVRPLARWVPWVLAGGILTIVALGMLEARPAVGGRMESDNWVIYLGEGIILVLLTIVVFDIVERWMLDGSAAPLSQHWRVPFYAMLVTTPIVVSALGRSLRVGDQWHSMVLNYLGRVHESFVGILLMCGTLLLVSSWEHKQWRRQVRPVLSYQGAPPAGLETRPSAQG